MEHGKGDAHRRVKLNKESIGCERAMRSRHKLEHGKGVNKKSIGCERAMRRRHKLEHGKKMTHRARKEK